MRNPRVLVVDRDTELADQLRRVSDRLRPRPEVLVCERVSCFDDALAEICPDVLVAGASVANRSALGRLAVAHIEFPAMSVVLAFAERPHANLREIVRTGAVDLLQLPVGDEILMETIERAIAMSRAPSETLASSSAPGGHSPGAVTTVLSASGGSGRTMYAANAAYFLHRMTGRPTCLVDLDLEFGNAATALRLKPRYTIADLVEKEEEGEIRLEGSIEDYLVRHDTGFHVLAAPRDPAEADGIDAAGVAWILQALRSRFAAVVVDTPRTLNETVLVALDLADSITVLAAFDLPSLRNLNVQLQTLQRLKLPAEGVHVVLNKSQPDVGIEVEQVARLLPQGFSAVVPLAAEVTKSVNVGTPVLAFAPTSAASLQIETGLRRLLGDLEPIPRDDPPRETRSLSRLLRRRAPAPAR